MRLRFAAVVAVVVATSLLGAVTGSVLGWASAPEPPDMDERGTWLAGRGRPAQEIANRYIDVLRRFIIDGLLIGGLLGGATGVAGVLLVNVRNPPARRREHRAPDHQERALAAAARQAARDPVEAPEEPLPSHKKAWAGWKLAAGGIVFLAVIVAAFVPFSTLEDAAVSVGQLLLLALVFYAMWGLGNG